MGLDRPSELEQPCPQIQRFARFRGMSIMVFGSWDIRAFRHLLTGESSQYTQKTESCPEMQPLRLLLVLPPTLSRDHFILIAPCMTRELSAAKRMPSSVIWTWTLCAKSMQRRSWYSGLGDVETARKTGLTSAAIVEKCPLWAGQWSNVGINGTGVRTDLVGVMK